MIFFNNAGYLQMCGHGTIGLVITLGYLGKVQPGLIRLETPAGVVEATWTGGPEVSLVNVPSYRAAAGVQVEVPGFGSLRGDVAWAGGRLLLTKDHQERLDLARVEHLTGFSARLREAVNSQGFPEVDHIELLGPARRMAEMPAVLFSAQVEPTIAHRAGRARARSWRAWPQTEC